MTIYTFLLELKSIMEWASNSEFVFALIVFSFSFVVLLPVFAHIVRFICDHFIFKRRLK